MRGGSGVDPWPLLGLVCAPYLLFAIDTSTALARRARAGESIFHAHRSHTYQRLANDLGVPHWVVSAGVVALSALVTCVVTIGALVGALHRRPRDGRVPQRTPAGGKAGGPVSLRVLMATHWFEPEGGAAGHPGIVARSLATRGHEVHVVTGFPTYPKGEIFDGYRNRIYQRETIDGMTVHRGAVYPSHDDRAAHRAANYLSYAAMGSLTALRTPKQLDVGLVYSSPATAAVPALVVHATRRLPFVVYVQDLWPDSVTASGFVDQQRQGLVERALHRYCGAVYSRASHIAVSAPGMATLLHERGVPPEKISVLPNWADERHFAPRRRNAELAQELGLAAPTVLMYAGNFGELQDLDTVVEAARLISHRSDILVALVGQGVTEARLRSAVEQHDLTNVRFVPPQPFESIAEILALADAQIVSLKDVPVLRSTLPSKLQANLAAGQPLIGAVSGDAAAVIEQTHAGVTTPPGDATALGRAMEWFADLPEAERENLRFNARSAYEQRFSEKVIGDELSALLHEAADRRG